MKDEFQQSIVTSRAVRNSARGPGISAIPSVARSRRGLHHLVVRQRVTDTQGLVIPVLFLFETGSDGEERTSRVEPLVDFFTAMPAYSDDWRMQHSCAIGMLWDYLVQRGPTHAARSRASALDFGRLVMWSFLESVFNGTVSVGPEAKPDVTGLYWRPRSVARTEALAAAVAGYAKWISGNTEPPLTIARTELDVPFAAAKLSGFVTAACNRGNYSLLAHVKTLRKRKRSAVHPGIVGRRGGHGEPDATVQFPRDYLAPLLCEAFVTRREGERMTRVNAAALVATALCAVGGLRISEAFHVWVTDVRMVGQRLEVFLFHPEQAVVDLAGCDLMSRAEYLRTRCLLEPRTSGTAGKYKVGWKGMALNTQHWNVLYPMPVPGAAELLTEILLDYIAVVRPAVMRKRATLGLPDHPFLLVSTGGGGSMPGDPYTMSACRTAWDGGIGRLARTYGDAELRVCKQQGTTQHGLRHLYGAVLAELKVPSEIIQRAMRHLSPFTQQVYTAPRSKVVNDTLNAAMASQGDGGLTQGFAPLRDVNGLLDGLRARREGRRW